MAISKRFLFGFTLVFVFLNTVMMVDVQDDDEGYYFTTENDVFNLEEAREWHSLWGQILEKQSQCLANPEEASLLKELEQLSENLKSQVEQKLAQKPTSINDEYLMPVAQLYTSVPQSLLQGVQYAAKLNKKQAFDDCKRIANAYVTSEQEIFDSYVALMEAGMASNEEE